jgi:hypothetical protein
MEHSDIEYGIVTLAETTDRGFIRRCKKRNKKEIDK